MVWANIKKTKLLICGLAGVLTMSMVQLPTAHAADSCFEAVGDTVDYDHGNTLHAKVKSTCEMELHSIIISFADTEKFEGIEELTPESTHSQINEIEISDDHLRLQWNIDESASYANVLSGEELFSMSYSVPLNTTVFKRNMPITIEYAEYKIGDEIRTEENVNLDAMLIVTHDGKEVVMVTGIEKQEVSYNGGPISLTGDLIIEDNPADITADKLTIKYYNAVALINDPSEPGDYVAVYSYEDGDYAASLKVPFTIKDYITTSLNIWSGHGEISAPAYIDKYNDFHVDIVPEDGYEVMWVTYNDYDVTEFLNDDYSLDVTGADEDAEIIVAFRPFYLVTDGDGGKYTKGSKNNLAFIVDKNPASYTSGMASIMVDDEYVDLDNDSIIEPATQSFTLLGNYLETLEPGVHRIELYFFDSDVAGIARATFTVVEAAEDESETVPAPETGMFTIETSGAEATSIITILSGITIAIILIIVKRYSKNSK